MASFPSAGNGASKDATHVLSTRGEGLFTGHFAMGSDRPPLVLFSDATAAVFLVVGVETWASTREITLEAGFADFLVILSMILLRRNFDTGRSFETGESFFFEQASFVFIVSELLDSLVATPTLVRSLRPSFDDIDIAPGFCLVAIVLGSPFSERLSRRSLCSLSGDLETT